MWKVTLVLVASAVVNRAEPKSIRTGRLSSLMRMLGGLMSRWRTPTRCARSSPSAIGRRMFHRLRSLNRRPCFSIRDSDMPSSKSITM